MAFSHDRLHPLKLLFKSSLLVEINGSKLYLEHLDLVQVFLVDVLELPVRCLHTLNHSVLFDDGLLLLPQSCLQIINLLAKLNDSVPSLAFGG